MNTAPVFQDAEGVKIPDGDKITRSVAENSRTGTRVGTPVSAKDIGENGRQETLTYVITAGNNDGLFTINSRSGQIRRSGCVDYEENDASHDITVAARDLCPMLRRGLTTNRYGRLNYGDHKHQQRE